MSQSEIINYTSPFGECSYTYNNNNNKKCCQTISRNTIEMQYKWQIQKKKRWVIVNTHQNTQKEKLENVWTNTFKFFWWNDKHILLHDTLYFLTAWRNILVHKINRIHSLYETSHTWCEFVTLGVKFCCQLGTSVCSLIVISLFLDPAHIQIRCWTCT